jgi:hypothetical protein
MEVLDLDKDSSTMYRLSRDQYGLSRYFSVLRCFYDGFRRATPPKLSSFGFVAN